MNSPRGVHDQHRATRLRRVGSLVVAGAIATLLASPAVAGAATCRLTPQQASSLGASYVQKLAQTRTTCAHARRITRAFHACRKKMGISGLCTAKVLLFSCAERRRATSTRYFRGEVTCTRGRARITHTYRQNTPR